MGRNPNTVYPGSTGCLNWSDYTDDPQPRFIRLSFTGIVSCLPPFVENPNGFIDVEHASGCFWTISTANLFYGFTFVLGFEVLVAETFGFNRELFRGGRMTDGTIVNALSCGGPAVGGQSGSCVWSYGDPTFGV